MNKLQKVSLCTAGLLPLAGANAQQASAQPSPERPNVIFIFTDDHAANAISAYNKALTHTPNMDRLAQNGMVFDQLHLDPFAGNGAHRQVQPPQRHPGLQRI